MKLKRKIMLFEDFETAQVTQTKVAKSVNTDSVATKVKSSDNIRTEVIADVDVILTNLETLSAQITEEFINEYNETILINENAADGLMKMFKSMAAMAKLSSSYPKMADNKAKLEVNKKIFGIKFDIKKIELLDAAMDKAKEQMNAKIEAIDDPAKRKVAKETRDGRLEELKKQQSTKLDRQKEDKNKKADRDISDASSAITKLTSENKIDSPILSAKWDGLKLKMDRKIEDKYLKIEREAYDEFIEDDERLAKMEAALLKRAKKEREESDEMLKKSVERAKREQEKLDAQIANATGEEKEALEKINDWNKAYSDFNSAMDLTEESTPEEKKAAQDASKLLSDANDKLNKSVMKAAFGYDNDMDAEAADGDFEEREAELQARYKTIKTEVGGSVEDDDDQSKSAEDVATEALGDAKDEYTKITTDQEGETIKVPSTEEGGEPTTKPKWTDIKKFKGKDAEGADTDKEVIYAKEVKESIRTPNKPKLYEGMSIADRFKILM